MIYISNTIKILYILVILGALFVGWLLWFKPVSATNVSQSFTICHHTPANTVTHTFQNLQSYLGHLGTPHSGSTFDTSGACPTPAPSSTPVPSVSPSSSPTAYPSATPEPSVEPSPRPSVTPAPTEAPAPQGSGPMAFSAPGAPECHDAKPKTLANFHIRRNGDLVEAVWVPETDGNQVQIFYWVNGQGVGNSVITENDGYELINLYDTQDYSFQAQVLNGCNASELSNIVVDGDTDQWTEFY